MIAIAVAYVGNEAWTYASEKFQIPRPMIVEPEPVLVIPGYNDKTRLIMNVEPRIDVNQTPSALEITCLDGDNIDRKIEWTIYNLSDTKNLQAVEGDLDFAAGEAYKLRRDPLPPGRYAVKFRYQDRDSIVNRPTKLFEIFGRDSIFR